MPYIENSRREDLSKNLPTPKTAGELNYTICMLIQNYLLDKKESYQLYNDAIGALEGAKLELYRRLVAPYEDMKIKENGDVF